MNNERFWPALTSLLVGLFLYFNPGYGALIAPAEDALVDLRMHRMQRQKASPDIILAGINEETIKSGNFNRAVHAQVIDNLSAAGVRCIFFDLLFDEARDPEVDRRLAQAVERSGVCVLAGAFKLGASLEMPKIIPPLEDVVRRKKALLGIINTNEDSVKRLLTIATEVEGQSPLFLSAALACYAQTQHIFPQQVRVQKHRLLVSPLMIPIIASEQKVNESADTVSERTMTFYKTLILFHPPATGMQGAQPHAFTVIPYHELKDPKSPLLAGLRGKIVIVGENTRTDTDTVGTPVGKIKGFEAHAQILNTLMAEVFVKRSTPGHRVFNADCLFIFSLCTLLAFRMARQSGPFQMTLIWLLGLIFGLGVHALMFRWGILLHLTLMLGSLGITFICLIGLRFETSRRILRTFIPEVVANQLLATGQSIEGDVEATVIVTDIRGYTTLSESKTPRQILIMLNEYHTETVAIFEKHGGHVLNFQGDAQIVIFGYPKKLRDAASQAIKAALATADAVNRLRAHWGITDKANFDVGCGVCTGPVSVGELGQEGIQAEYTVIGETVRLCHKVQSMSTTLDGNVLMDTATFNACKTKPAVTEFKNVELEAIPYPVTIYRADATSSKSSK